MYIFEYLLFGLWYIFLYCSHFINESNIDFQSTTLNQQFCLIREYYPKIMVKVYTYTYVYVLHHIL